MASERIDDLLVLNAVIVEANDWCEWEDVVSPGTLHHLASGDTWLSRNGQVSASLRRLRQRGLVERVVAKGHRMYRATPAGHDERALYAGDLPGPFCRSCWQREAVALDVPPMPHLFVGCGWSSVLCAECLVDRAERGVEDARESVAKELSELADFVTWREQVVAAAEAVAA